LRWACALSFSKEELMTHLATKLREIGRDELSRQCGVTRDEPEGVE
jgi:hypothetical protein